MNPEKDASERVVSQAIIFDSWYRNQKFRCYYNDNEGDTSRDVGGK